MAHRHFEGALHAQLYSKYRPIPPNRLIQRLVNFVKERYSGPLDTCYDVGCGSGQSTGFFSPHFRQVVGIDISAEQIRNSQEQNSFLNVNFIVSPAEKFDELKSSSIELVTACQAAHWFNLHDFYREANRVLRKDGVLGLYGYEDPCFVTGDPERDRKLDERCQHVYSIDLNGYFDPFRKCVDRKYTDSIFTFASDRTSDSKQTDANQQQLLFTDFTREEEFFDDIECTLADMVNYCLTCLVEILEPGSRAEDIKIHKRTKFFLLMGRK